MEHKELREQFPWLKGLDPVATDILNTLWEKERHYQGSWQKRGGPGAFMMLARKWDRLETIAREQHNYDIFAALAANTGDINDDIRDLVGYLLLVLAKHRVDAEPHTENMTQEQYDQMRAQKINENSGYQTIQGFEPKGPSIDISEHVRKVDHPAPYGYEEETPPAPPKHRPLKG